MVAVLNVEMEFIFVDLVTVVVMVYVLKIILVIFANLRFKHA